MITIPSQVSVYVACDPVDFRNGIDGLCGICQKQLRHNPQGGAYFVFRNKRKKSLKILFYDGEGFWLLMKRLSRGRIKWWPSSTKKCCELKSRELQTLIFGGNPRGAEFGNDWKKVFR